MEWAGMEWEFAPMAAQARLVRAVLTTTLTDGGFGAVVDDVVLLAHEVFANAVAHAGAETDVVRVQVAAVDDGIRVAVTDGCAKRPMRRPIAGDEDESGRGLALLEAVAARWGSDPFGAGKTVWFVCRTPNPNDTSSEAKVDGPSDPWLT